MNAPIRIALAALAMIATSALAGAAPQAVSTIEATIKRLRAKSKFFFISFLLELIGLRNFLDRIMNLWRTHLLNPEAWNPCFEPPVSGPLPGPFNSRKRRFAQVNHLMEKMN